MRALGAQHEPRQPCAKPASAHTQRTEKKHTQHKTKKKNNKAIKRALDARARMRSRSRSRSACVRLRARERLCVCVRVRQLFYDDMCVCARALACVCLHVLGALYGVCTYVHRFELPSALGRASVYTVLCPSLALSMLLARSLRQIVAHSHSLASLWLARFDI